MPVTMIDNSSNDLRPGIITPLGDDDEQTHELTHEAMLTTVDNPYDPFAEWDQWYAWDFEAGYHTPGLLARILRTSDDLSDADQRRDTELAINTIVRANWYEVHRKLMRTLVP